MNQSKSCHALFIQCPPGDAVFWIRFRMMLFAYVFPEAASQRPSSNWPMPMDTTSFEQLLAAECNKSLAIITKSSAAAELSEVAPPGRPSWQWRFSSLSPRMDGEKRHKKITGGDSSVAVVEFCNHDGDDDADDDADSEGEIVVVVILFGNLPLAERWSVWVHLISARHPIESHPHLPPPSAFVDTRIVGRKKLDNLEIGNTCYSTVFRVFHCAFDTWFNPSP